MSVAGRGRSPGCCSGCCCVEASPHGPSISYVLAGFADRCKQGSMLLCTVSADGHWGVSSSELRGLVFHFGRALAVALVWSFGRELGIFLMDYPASFSIGHRGALWMVERRQGSYGNHMGTSVQGHLPLATSTPEVNRSSQEGGHSWTGIRGPREFWSHSSGTMGL